jgi:hypothetical protein
MAIDLDQNVLAIGHSLGPFGEGQHYIRVGPTNHVLDDARYGAWVLAHGPAPIATAGELWPDWTVRSAVGWGDKLGIPVAEVIGDLVDQGLVAVLPPGDPGSQAEFAAGHRLVPLTLALGNTAQRPERFWLGRLGAEVLWVPAEVGLVWQLSPLFGSLAEAVAAAAELGELPEAELLDLVLGVLPRILVEDVAHLDTRWQGPPPAEFTGRVLGPPDTGGEALRLFPIGQFGGTIFDPDSNAPGEQSARIGREDVPFADEFNAAVWHLVHTARTRDDLRREYATWAAETHPEPAYWAAASTPRPPADPDQILDRLIEAGQVVEVRPESEQAVEFTRRYRVQYLHSGLGTTRDVLYEVGVVGGARMAVLHWLDADIWWRSADGGSLWETCERIAEEARRSGNGPPQQADPRWVAKVALETVGDLVSTGIGYLDLAR